MTTTLTVAINDSAVDLTAIYLNGHKITEAKDYELTPFEVLTLLQSYGLLDENVEVNMSIVEFHGTVSGYPDEIVG